MNLNLSVKELATLVNATHPNTNQDFIIKNILSLESAGPDDMAVILERGDASVFGSLSLEKIKNSNAGLILASSPVVDGKDYLLVDDALVAFTKIVDHIQKDTNPIDDFLVTPTHAYISKSATIASSVTIGVGAVICADVHIGEQSNIGAQSFVGKGCRIGANVLIHPGVKILDRCIIGDGTIVHSGTVIGSDGFGYEVTHQGLRKIPQIGIVVVGKIVEIGANCSIDRASFDKTVIGNGVKLDNAVHIAHNVIIGDCTAILAQTGIAGSAKIGIGCQIGGQVAIKNDVVIGNGVKIVSKSAVLNNLNDGETVCGIPAIPFMQWKRLHALNSKLPEWSKLVTTIKTIIERQNQSIWEKIKFLIKR